MFPRQQFLMKFFIPDIFDENAAIGGEIEIKRNVA
jgi:hypothetical protein